MTFFVKGYEIEHC